MYLIIDKEYRIFQTRMLTAATRAACDLGEVSVIHVDFEKQQIKGQNRPEYREKYGGEWSQFPHWAGIDLPIYAIENAVKKVSASRKVNDT